MKSRADFPFADENRTRTTCAASQGGKSSVDSEQADYEARILASCGWSDNRMVLLNDTANASNPVQSLAASLCETTDNPEPNTTPRSEVSIK